VSVHPRTSTQTHPFRPRHIRPTVLSSRGIPAQPDNREGDPRQLPGGGCRSSYRAGIRDERPPRLLTAAGPGPAAPARRCLVPPCFLARPSRESPSLHPRHRLTPRDRSRPPLLSSRWARQRDPFRSATCVPLPTTRPPFSRGSGSPSPFPDPGAVFPSVWRGCAPRASRGGGRHREVSPYPGAAGRVQRMGGLRDRLHVLALSLAELGRALEAAGRPCPRSRACEYAEFEWLLSLSFPSPVDRPPSSAPPFRRRSTTTRWGCARGRMRRAIHFAVPVASWWLRRREELLPHARSS